MIRMLLWRWPTPESRCQSEHLIGEDILRTAGFSTTAAKTATSAFGRKSHPFSLGVARLIFEAIRLWVSQARRPFRYPNGRRGLQPSAVRSVASTMRLWLGFVYVRWAQNATEKRMESKLSKNTKRGGSSYTRQDVCPKMLWCSARSSQASAAAGCGTEPSVKKSWLPNARPGMLNRIQHCSKPLQFCFCVFRRKTE